MARRNIGVALEVPEPYATELQVWRQRLGDPAAMRIPPHITLLPPTAVVDTRLDEVDAHLGEVAERARAFEVRLRGTGTFRPISPVTFVSLALGISSCERLESQVRNGPLRRSVKFPYHPHVTVAQDVAEEQLERGFRELSTYEAVFTAWGFTLFEEGRDHVWRPQRDFPFGRDPVGPVPASD